MKTILAALCAISLFGQTAAINGVPGQKLAIDATVNAQTGTSYTILDSDRGKLITGTNGSSMAYTLPQAGASSQFASGWYADIQNRGAGTMTITPTTSTIDGASTLVLTAGQGARIFSNGSNYFAMKGVGGTGSGDVVAAGNNTYTGYNNFSGGSMRFPESLIGSLPTASSNTGKAYVVTDSIGYSCSSGTGTTGNRLLCSSNGSSWVPVVPLPSNGVGLSMSCSSGVCTLSSNPAELGVVVSVTGGGTATRTCTVPTGALVATCYISSLDATVTTYNLNGLVNGQRITSRICRDGTATRTMAWPSNMLGFLDPIQITSGCTIQSGTVIASNLVADNSATFVDAGATGVGNFSLALKGSAVPTAAIPSGWLALYAGTDDAFHSKTSGGTDTALGAGGGGSTVTCGAGTTTTATSPTALATVTFGSGLTAGTMLKITTFWKHTGGTSNTPRMTMTLGGTNIDLSGNVSWAAATDTIAAFNAVIQVIDTTHQRVQGGYFRGANWQNGAYWGIYNDALTVNVSSSVDLVFNGYFASGSGETLSLDHYCAERIG